MDNQERLQKVMAQSGIASRRKSEELIKEGKVKVNGKVVTELGTKIGKKDVITVEDKPVNKEDLVYYLLNKPTGYITTTSDEHERRTVLDLILPQHLDKRLFPVGRLDYDTSGALLLTNDGNLTNILLSSKNEVEKEYHVRAEGILNVNALMRLIKGVEIDGVMTKKSQAELISTDKKNNSSLVKIIITEGKNKQVRRMFEAIGHPVKKLKRVNFAGISIEDLKKGEYRMLKIHEVKQLYKYK